MNTKLLNYQLNRPLTELEKEKEQLEIALKFHKQHEEISSERNKKLEQKVERINTHLRQNTVEE